MSPRGQGFKSQKNLYIRWNENSTTVYHMKANDELVDIAVEKIKNIYYSKTPKMPTKITDDVKDLAKSLNSYRLTAEFIGEFPSLLRVPRETISPGRNSKSPYLLPLAMDTTDCIDQMTLNELLDIAIKATKCVEESYRLRKPIASEVLVYLSDMDRSWDKEIGHGIPISYLFKVYSLTKPTARRIMEAILQACHDAKAHVPCVTFDGQFAKLKDFDLQERPLTLFGVQRQLWNETKSMSKKHILDFLLCVYGACEYSCQYDLQVSEDGILNITHFKIYVVNKVKGYPQIITPAWLLKDNSDKTISQEDPTDSETMHDDDENMILSMMNENLGLE